MSAKDRYNQEWSDDINQLHDKSVTPKPTGKRLLPTIAPSFVDRTLNAFMRAYSIAFIVSVAVVTSIALMRGN